MSKETVPKVFVQLRASFVFLRGKKIKYYYTEIHEESTEIHEVIQLNNF